MKNHKCRQQTKQIKPMSLVVRLQSENLNYSIHSSHSFHYKNECVGKIRSSTVKWSQLALCRIFWTSVTIKWTSFHKPTEASWLWRFSCMVHNHFRYKFFQKNCFSLCTQNKNIKLGFDDENHLTESRILCFARPVVACRFLENIDGSYTQHTHYMAFSSFNEWSIKHSFVHSKFEQADKN